MKERLKRLFGWLVPGSLAPVFALVARAAVCPAGQPAIFLDNSTGPVTIQECINGSNILLWTAPRFVDGEVLIGAADGKNALLVMAHVPINAPLITMNGVVLKSGSDYTLKANLITFAKPLVKGDVLLAWYRY